MLGYRNFINYLFIFILTVAGSANAFLKCSGQNFIDSTGNEVFMRGIGLGGWLVPEGYMLHIPGFGSPTSIRNMINDLIGSENTEEFYSIYRANYVCEKDIQILAEMGFNSIRLPFNYRLLSPEDQPGVYLEEGFAIIDSLVQWCKNNDLYLILDMHCAPGGQNAGNISDSDGIEARLWTEPDNQRRTAQIWKKIAVRYADEKTIAGYDLLNEPVLPSGFNGTDLRNLYIEITDSIRKADENHIVFIEGNIYATDFSQLDPPWDSKLSYSFHKYWNETTYTSIEPYIIIRVRNNAPLWMGESGENSNHWFAETVNLLETNDISWCWWTHKKIETTTSSYSAPITQAYQLILDYWNDNGPKPSVEFAKNALFDMAQRLNIDQCVYLPDVTASLFDPEFRTISKAFKSHSIPGHINMADYDLGGNGISSSDADFQKTRWDEYQPWNIGGKYRNDGVDIEESHDDSGPVYSVGWIKDNEWLQFTVNVNKSDLYDVSFRVASMNDNGRIYLLRDEEILISSISIPSTGGWYNWQDVVVNDVSIPQGACTIKVKFINEGFNISRMSFTGQSTEIKVGMHQKQPQDFYLGQNFPNPFNGFTRIPFNITESGSIKIYNTTGSLIRTISISGKYSVIWDGRDSENQKVGSGLYFYSIKAGKQILTKKMLYLQ